MTLNAIQSRISPNYVPPVHPGGPSLIRANLVALWVETVLCGVFLLLFIASLYIFLYVKRGENVRMNRVLAVASVMMFLLITGHVVCDLLQAIKAFTTRTTPPDVVYVNIHANIQYAKAVMYFTLSLISDTIIVYRCWVLWEGKPVAVALPCFLCVATAVVGAFSLNFLMDAKHAGICIMELGNWALAFFSLTLATNGLCTLLIAARIWLLRKSQKNWTDRLFFVLLVFVHSAAIYTIALVTMIGTYVSKSNAQYIALDALPPIIGIVFELIILLVALGLSGESHDR